MMNHGVIWLLWRLDVTWPVPKSDPGLTTHNLGDISLTMKHWNVALWYVNTNQAISHRGGKWEYCTPSYLYGTTSLHSYTYGTTASARLTVFQHTGTGHAFSWRFITANLAKTTRYILMEAGCHPHTRITNSNTEQQARPTHMAEIKNRYLAH